MQFGRAQREKASSCGSQVSNKISSLCPLMEDIPHQGCHIIKILGSHQHRAGNSMKTNMARITTT